MALNEMLQQLTGGGKEGGPCLGLYISPELLCLTEAQLDAKGRPSARKTVQIPVPPRTGEASTRMGTLNTDFLSESAKLVDLIKPAMAQGGWQARKLVVTLSPHFGLSRYFVMPYVDRRFWRQSVPLEAKKYIPFPLGDLKYDFQVFPMPPGQDGRARMGVLFAVTPQKNIESIQALARALTINLTAVELAAISNGRIWKSLSSGKGAASTVAQVHFDKQSAYIVLHDAGIPYIAREVHWAGELQDRRRIDLQGSIEFAKKQLGLQDIRVMLTGSVELASWGQSLQEESLVQVEQVDLAKAIDAAQPEWPLLSSIGASLRFGAGGAVVDVSQTRELLTEDPRVIRALSVVAASLIGVMLLLSAFSQLQVMSAQRQLSGLKRKTSGIMVFDGLSGKQVEDVVDKIRKQSLAYEDFMGPRDYATGLLSILPSALPETVWLESLEYQSPMGQKNAPKTLSLGGFAFGSDKNADIVLANQFRDALKKNSAFSKIFPECDLSFEGGRSGDKDAYRRTAFTVRCTKRIGGPVGGGAL